MRDKRVEDFLDLLAVKYQYVEEFPLLKIADNKKYLKQIRFSEKVDTYQIDKMLLSLEQSEGDQSAFPPIIVLPVKGKVIDLATSDKSAIVIAGTHRYTAFTRRGITTHPAYVLPDVTDSVALMVAVRDNSTHGLGYKRDEALQLGELLVKEDMPIKNAAEMANVKMSALGHKIKQTDGVALLLAAGMRKPETDKIKPSLVERITQLRRPATHLALGRAMIATAMETAQLDTIMYRLLNEATSDQHELDIIEEYLDSPIVKKRIVSVAVGGKRTIDPVQQFKNRIESLLRLLPLKTQTTDEALLEELCDLCDEVVNEMELTRAILQEKINA